MLKTSILNTNILGEYFFKEGSHKTVPFKANLDKEFDPVNCFIKRGKSFIFPHCSVLFYFSFVTIKRNIAFSYSCHLHLVRSLKPLFNRVNLRYSVRTT